MKTKSTSGKNARRAFSVRPALLLALICCLAGVQLYAQPPAPAVTGTTVACTGTTIMLTASGQAGASFQWWDAPTGGALLGTNASYSPGSQTTAGTYHWYVQQTVNNLTSARTNVTVTVNQTPAVSVLPASPSVSCPGNNIVLTASGATTYSWSPGGATGSALSVNPVVNTSYTVTGTANGCAASVTKNITVNGITTASANVAICRGDTAILSATGASSYVWSPGGQSGNSLQVSPTNTTTYIVSGTSPGCTSTDTVVVTVHAPAAVPTTGYNIFMAEGTIANLTCSSALPATYVWTPNDGNAGTLSGNSVMVVPTQTTTYTVTATDGLGCKATATQTVTINRLPVVSGTATVCSGTATTLTASGTGPFAWYDDPGVGNLLGTGATFNTGNLSANKSYWLSDNSSTRKEVKVTVAGLVSSISATPSSLCGSGTSKLRSTYALGPVNWYDAPTGGNLIGTTASDTSSLSVTPTATTTYYAQAGASSQYNLTFNYTGTVQTWTVPAGVTSITIDAYGSAGARPPTATSKNYIGKGGRVQATMNVTPGQVLNIYVGGKNMFNGGANGPQGYAFSGSKGGDATDIRIGGTALTNRVLVAGGGGGIGAYSATGVAVPLRGNGGGLVGQDGGYYNTSSIRAGTGATQSIGGNPGKIYASDVFPTAGLPGAFGQGGQAGGSVGVGGGGGGGGWYGGGGGTDIGDGGGGSSYANPALCHNVIHTQGAWDTTGVLLISYGISCAGTTARTPVTITVNPVPASVSLSGPHCSGDTIMLTAPFMPAQIQWKSGNTVVLNDAPATWNASANVALAAGNGTLGPDPNQLYWPRHAFVDGAGNVFVADQNNNRIVKWAPGATSGVTVAGGNGPGSSPGQLYWPYGVCVDASQNVYVADYNNGRIQKWAPGATSGVTVAGGNGTGPGADQFYHPVNLTIDTSGTLYVADYGNNRVQKWTPGATQGVTVAGMINGTLSGPTAVKLDAANNIYVSEENNGRVTKWTPGNNNSGTIVASGLNGPSDLDIDGAGNLYINDKNNYRIQRWAPNAASGTTVVGGASGTGPNQLSDPLGVALDKAGNIYVTEFGGRVKKFMLQYNTDSSSFAPTVAGNYTVKVTNFAGCSTIATKAIDQQAVIGTEPAGKTVCSGSAIALSTTATGATGYQWQKNGTNIPAATGATYNLTNSTTANDIGLYKVIAKGGNGCNDTSANAAVIVNTVPVVSLAGPSCSGDTLNLTASFVPAQIQWQSGSNLLRTDTATWNSNGTTVISGSISPAPAQLFGPRHAFVTATGNLYVVDAGNNRVVKWAAGGSSGTVVAGGNGQGANANQLNQPYSVYVDAAENMYIADFGNHRVQKWDKNAITGTTVAGTGTAGTTPAQLNGPDYVTMDASGNLYVTEYNNHRVTKWAPGATQGTTVAGIGNGANGSGNNALNAPNAARVDSAGNIYVADGGNNRVVKWTAGNGTPVVTGFAGWASDLEIDRKGNIYITDETNNRVQRWTPATASLVTIAGTGTAGTVANQLNSPSGIALDQNGNLYVSDRVNNRVQMFAINNTFLYSSTTSAGSYTATVTSFAGCAATTAVKTIGQKAIISTNPVGGTVCSGSAFAFTPVITGAIGGYQWTKNGTNIPAATAAALNIVSTADSDNAIYQVMAIGSGGCNATSAKVTLTVNPTPVISLSGSLCSGDTINLNTSFAPGLLQWKSGSTVMRTDTGFYNGGISFTAYGDVYTNQGLTGLAGARNIYVDHAQNLYVADDNNGLVIKWPPGGLYGMGAGIAVAGGYFGSGPSSNQLSQPNGVYVDAAENVYVADFGNHRIQKWAPNAPYGATVAGISSYPGTGADQLNGPVHVTMDTAGNLYVTEYYNNRVTKWAPGATQGVTVAGSSNGAAGSGNNELNHPRAAKVDAAGNIYVADNGNNRVVKYTGGTGVVVAGMGGSGSGPAQLNSPMALDVDAMGNIYIADENNNRIQRWAPGAASGTTIAGPGTAGYGSNQQLNDPVGVALDANGNLFVSDRGNYQVAEYPIHMNTLSPPTTAGNYTATVTTLTGCAATTPVQAINQSATFGTEPEASKMVCTTNPIVLTSAATNTSAYQWQQNGTDIPAATTAVLNKANSVIADAGTYRVIATGAAGCNDTSTISIVSVNIMSNSLPLINTMASNMHIDGLAYNYTDSSCRPVAGITDAAGGNVLGSVDASLVFDSTVQVFNGTPYVQRHFNLQPSSDGAATVELYALQSEFDAYNTYVAAHTLGLPLLPTGPSDSAGKANIIVAQYHGTPASGTSGPGGQYNAGQSEQIPNNMITTSWNGSYWTLAFPVNGFSGFFISTADIGTPLVIRLKDISARNAGSRNIVDWQTAAEDAGDYFEVERSLDAKLFSRIGVVAARYRTGGSYQLIDEHPGSGINYYRLKMMDASGGSNYSKVVTANVNGAGFVIEVFPNPAKGVINVRTNGKTDSEATITLSDISGRTIYSTPVDGNQTTLDVQGLAGGVYLLRYQSGSYSQNIRFTKE
ncbi:Ig-like domain-containing protein [Taibaiella koreensis]|uniref:Ig-like domain-containing protein n=1 Tax=Taibaiella koreensis TaxID=1268548 RepID=UPI000E59D17E|nr:glycine-rich protein [Taibaiella koreensis]